MVDHASTTIIAARSPSGTRGPMRRDVRVRTTRDDARNNGRLRIIVMMCCGRRRVRAPSRNSFPPSQYLWRERKFIPPPRARPSAPPGCARVRELIENDLRDVRPAVQAFSALVP